MSHFENYFWSADYATGINVIFEKLFQGCAENAEALNMVEERIRLESNYATGLQSFPVTLKPTSDGFDRDEGATLRQAYVSFLDEIGSQGQLHAEIATKLDRGVRGPFHTWANSHKKRITAAHSKITSQIKAYNKKEAKALKSQQNYFSKCRQLDDADITPEFTRELEDNQSQLEVSNGAPIAGTAAVEWATNIAKTIHSRTTSSSNSSTERVPADESVLLAGTSYTPYAMAQLLKDMLNDIPYGDFKIAILGTYESVSTGDEIAMWARKRLNCKNVGKAERFGQGLIDYGFLRAVGRVGNKFVNSASYGYQWTTKALDYDPDALFPPPESEESKQHQPTNNASVGEYFTGLLKAQTAPKELYKIHREIAEADEKYQNDVIELDLERCYLEESISETLKFMEQCEVDRLKAIQTVLGDFSHAVASPLTKIGPVVKRLSQHQHAVNPASDLNYMIENYKTSTLAPKIFIYESFHSAAKCQTFGVDLPSATFVVPTFLDYLTKQEEQPITAALWIAQAPLSNVHQLRNQINNGVEFDPLTILPSFPVQVVVSTLKQFLLELQDSLVSFTLYNVIKNVYGKQAGLDQVASALSNLPKVNVDTLELLFGHIAPLCKTNVGEGTGNTKNKGQEEDSNEEDNKKISVNDHENSEAFDDKIVGKIANSLGRYIIRPRVINAATMSDKHPSLLVEDMIRNSTKLFTIVRARQANNKAPRDRSISEANRRANVEARHREMVEKSASARAARSNTASPSPSGRGSPYSHGNNPSIISSNGLLPLALSPAREPASATGTPNIKRISSSSLTTPQSAGSASKSHLRHQKSLSTPIKTPIAAISTPRGGGAGAYTSSPRSSFSSPAAPDDLQVRRDRGRSFRGAALPNVQVSPVPDESEEDIEEPSIPQYMNTPPQQFDPDPDTLKTPQQQIIPSESSETPSTDVPNDSLRDLRSADDEKDYDDDDDDDDEKVTTDSGFTEKTDDTEVTSNSESK